MNLPFCLIDTDTANMIGAFPSELAALQAVADTARHYGPRSDAATSLALVRDDVPDGRLIARGTALVELALSRFPLMDKRKRATG